MDLSVGTSRRLSVYRRRRSSTRARGAVVIYGGLREGLGEDVDRVRRERGLVRGLGRGGTEPGKVVHETLE